MTRLERRGALTAAAMVVLVVVALFLSYALG